MDYRKFQGKQVRLLVKFKPDSPSWTRFKPFITAVVFIDCRADILIRVVEITDEPINNHLSAYDIAHLKENGLPQKT